MLLSPSPIGYAVCDTARKAGVDVDDQDPAPLAMRGATPAMEGDLLPIGGPRRSPIPQRAGGWVIWRMWLPLGYIVKMVLLVPSRSKKRRKTIRPSVEAVPPLVLLLCSWPAPPLAEFSPPPPPPSDPTTLMKRNSTTMIPRPPVRIGCLRHQPRCAGCSCVACSCARCWCAGSPGALAPG